MKLRLVQKKLFMANLFSDRRITFCIIAVYITLCTVREMYFMSETIL